MISTESTAGKIVLTDVPSDLLVLKYKHNETMRHMFRHVIEKKILSLLPNTKKLTFLILAGKKVRSTDFRLFGVKYHQRLV